MFKSSTPFKKSLLNSNLYVGNVPVGCIKSQGHLFGTIYRVDSKQHLIVVPNKIKEVKSRKE
jgi:hypothetical protein